MRNLRYLHSIGYTGEDVILAHCIWIDDDEIRILADTGTHAVHCPSSNMKLASGIARIDEMLAAGCRVALGLDGAHNHMDALVELRQAGILQKVRTNRPTALSPLQALEMATLGGARALGQEDELGSLEPGKKADLAVINPDRLNMAPRIGRDPVAQVVYQATHENVEATMVDGVYDSDPKKNPNAKKYDHLTYMEILNQDLQVMDMTAASFCNDRGIPFLVFSIEDPENIVRAVCGENVGTVITKD